MTESKDMRPEMTVEAALAVHPQAAVLFASLGFGEPGVRGVELADTLRDVCGRFQLPESELIEALELLATGGESPTASDRTPR